MRRRIFPVLLALFTAALFLSYLLPFPRNGERFGFPLDDGWIHATYARNLAERGEFSFNPGETSTGTTSLLWTLLLAGCSAAGADIVRSAFLLGIGAFLWFLFSLYALTARIFSSRTCGFFAGVAAICSGFAPWWSLSGMETMLFLALGLGALEAFAGRKHFVSAVLLALLTLTRPEGILLAGILLIFLWRERKGERTRLSFAARFACTAFSGGAIYAAWNLILTGRFVTSTLAGRRWLANAPIEMPLDPLYYLQKGGLLVVGWMRILAFSYLPQKAAGSLIAGLLISLSLVFLLWRPLGRMRIALFAGFGAALAGALLILLLLIPEGSMDRIINSGRQDGTGAGHTLVKGFESTGSGLSGKRLRITGTATGSCLLAGGLFILLFRRSAAGGDGNRLRSSVPARIFLLWILAHNLMYVIFIPYPGHAGRYQSINLVLLIWLTLAGWNALASARPRRASGRKLRLALIGAAAFASIAIGRYSVVGWRTIYFSTVEHINHVHRQSAEWIDRWTPREARIAAFDIGAIGYFGHRRVIDLGGLISPDPIPYMAAGEIDDYIALCRATHLAMVYRFDERQDARSIAKQLGINSGGRFTALPLYIAQYDSLAWRRNVGVAGNAYPIMEVSKIIYPGRDR